MAHPQQYYPPPAPAGQCSYPPQQHDYYQRQQSPYGYPSPQQQDWHPRPPVEGGFHAHPSHQSWNPEEIWNTYNNPLTPQYGKRHDQVPIGDPSRDFNMQSLPNSNGGGLGDDDSSGDGERGLGATVLGGGAGALLGHKLEGGRMGTIGGVLLGALVANAFEHHEKKKKEERREHQAFDEGEHYGSRSRGLEDENRFDRDRDRGFDDDYERPPSHHHRHHHYDRDYDDDDRRDYSDDYRSKYDGEYRDDYRSEVSRYRDEY